jgi:hypothetical protein
MGTLERLLMSGNFPAKQSTAQTAEWRPIFLSSEHVARAARISSGAEARLE